MKKSLKITLIVSSIAIAIAIVLVFVPVSFKSLACKDDLRFSIFSGQLDDYNNAQPRYPGPTEGVCVSKGWARLYIF